MLESKPFLSFLFFVHFCFYVFSRLKKLFFLFFSLKSKKKRVQKEKKNSRHLFPQLSALLKEAGVDVEVWSQCNGKKSDDPIFGPAKPEMMTLIMNDIHAVKKAREKKEIKENFQFNLHDDLAMFSLVMDEKKPKLVPSQNHPRVHEWLQPLKINNMFHARHLDHFATVFLQWPSLRTSIANIHLFVFLHLQLKVELFMLCKESEPWVPFLLSTSSQSSQSSQFSQSTEIPMEAFFGTVGTKPYPSSSIPYPKEIQEKYIVYHTKFSRCHPNLRKLEPEKSLEKDEPVTKGKDVEQDEMTQSQVYVEELTDLIVSSLPQCASEDVFAIFGCEQGVEFHQEVARYTELPDDLWDWNCCYVNKMPRYCTKHHQSLMRNFKPHFPLPPTTVAIEPSDDDSDNILTQFSTGLFD